MASEAQVRAISKYQRKLRNEVLAAYGSVCTACGADETLHLHHINGNGVEHRKERRGAQIGTYLHLRELGWPATGEYACALLCRPCHRSQ